jgi:hypothetical protein
MLEFWWWLNDSWGGVVSTLQAIAVGGAAVATALAARKGLKTWAEQLHGSTRYEVARRLARATYKLRDAMAFSRSPLVEAAEFPSGYSDRGNAAENAQAWQHVFSARMRPVLEAAREFDAEALEAEAIWGSSAASACKAMMRVVRELQVSMQAFVEDQSQAGRNFESDARFGQRMRANVFSGVQSDDALTQAISDAIAGIEAVVRPALKN